MNQRLISLSHAGTCIKSYWGGALGKRSEPEEVESFFEKGVELPYLGKEEDGQSKVRHYHDSHHHHKTLQQLGNSLCNHLQRWDGHGSEEGEEERGRRGGRGGEEERRERRG